jgi:CRP/FNR family transcriptional regulator, anaerobic regulatory protein
MDPLRGSAVRHGDISPLTHEASRRNRVAGSPQLRSALSRVSALQVELTSNRQELLEFRTQVAKLSGKNDQPMRRVAQFEGKAASPIRNGSAFIIANVLTRGLGEDFSDWVRLLLATRVHVRRGEVLFRTGAPCRGLYVVRNGSLKTVLIAKNGKTQIGGFHLAGDLVGLDSMFGRMHQSQVVALEDTDTSHMPLEHVDFLARACERFRHNLYTALAAESARAHALVLTLGTGRADQRVAGFLLELSRRFHAIGYSSSEFNLRMTRCEIGSYLGLKLETVSRLFSRLHRDGIIGVDGRAVRLFNRKTLQQIADDDT